MAHPPSLRQRYRLIFAYTGLIGIIIGGVMLLPLLALCSYPAEWRLAWGFLLPGGLLIGSGWLLWQKLNPSRAESSQRLSIRDATVVVVLSWLLAIGVSTVPYLAFEGLSVTQATFEATSGWTTTGLSVLTIEKSSHLVLLFRSLTQLFGGAGFAIIALSGLSSLTGIMTPELSVAEGRAEQLVPHVQRSAKWVMSLYFGYVAAGIIALRLAGMSLFEAVNHAFCTLSTGGFSTRVASIAAWDSPQVEFVTIALMLLGSLNYVTGYLALTGRIQSVWRNSELRLQTSIVGVAMLLLWLSFRAMSPGSISSSAMSSSAMSTSAIRSSLFATVTALSTTGFATVDYGKASGFSLLVSIVLMIIGGQSGSTAGGLKLYRLGVLLQSLLWEIKRCFLPKHAVTEWSLWQGDRPHFLSDRDTLKASSYLLLYLLVLMIGTGILTAHGNSLQDSLFEYASALSTVGLSVGITQPAAPVSVLWAEIMGMLLGRLEIMAALIGLLQVGRDLRGIRLNLRR